ncbi:MAG: IS1595 family transposase [Stellaceae bacterium]
MPSVLSAPHFHDEAAAYAYVEARVWPNGRVCPHCGVVDTSGPLKGKTNRIGLYKCYACRKPLSVKIGTIFEASHIPMHVWLQAMFLVASSKKGISAHQLQRTLGVTIKTAWFLGHRIREAMDDGYIHPGGKMGGDGKIVEADETVFGPDLQKDTRARARYPEKHTHAHLVTIYSLVERGGEVRSFHVKDGSSLTLTGIMQDQVSEKSLVMTDENAAYHPVRRMFLAHSTVNHGKGEYVRDAAHTNSVENFFSIFKRGLYGTYQHMSQKHLARYLAEFDFRYNNRKALGIEDQERAENIVKGAPGKRLTYRIPRSGTGKAAVDAPPPA